MRQEMAQARRSAVSVTRILRNINPFGPYKIDHGIRCNLNRRICSAGGQSIPFRKSIS